MIVAFWITIQITPLFVCTSHRVASAISCSQAWTSLGFSHLQGGSNGGHRAQKSCSSWVFTIY